VKSFKDGRTYSLTQYGSKDGNFYGIIDCGTKDYCNVGIDPIIWKRAIADGEDDESGQGYPADVRAKYEELLGRSEFLPDAAPEPPAFVNIVEMISDSDDNAWDQPCAHGYRVAGHAVYCHNERWLYAPRKCRRGEQWDGTDWPHAKCPGYKPNPTAQKTARATAVPRS
jgi:hypothetical protein